MYGGPLFSTKNKSLCIKNDRKLITDFLIYECLHLTGPEVPVGGIWVFFWVGMCRPGLQIGTPFLKKFPLKLIPRSRNGPIFYTPF